MKQIIWTTREREKVTAWSSQHVAADGLRGFRPAQRRVCLLGDMPTHTEGHMGPGVL